MDIVEAVQGRCDDGLQEKFNAAMACLQRTIELYSTAGIAFSFNGGKDSTVLLHLLRAAVATCPQIVSSANHSRGLGGICTFIFERKDDFPEILNFVRETDKAYTLHMEELTGGFKSGLSSLLSRKPIKAVVIGTRRGDPNAGGQDIFCPSSAGWPPFMRVNPILDWTYADVWAFLRGTAVDYCSLYDRGYTSVGSVTTTHPNSSLQKSDGSFAPAYMLADNRMERTGRVVAGTPKAGDTPAFTSSAIIVIIGDEILSGKVPDQNAQFLCQELFLLGWRVVKVVSIPDDVSAISQEVHSASESCDIVITTGGVGPTVDDVTMAGVCRALGCPLVHDQGLEKRLREYFGEHITNAHLKMAEAPAEEVKFVEVPLEGGGLSPFPIIHCRNVYILPGVPSLLHRKWKVLKEELRGMKVPPFRSVALRLSLEDETHIAAALEGASLQHASVSMGSYPVSHQADGTGIVLALESKDLPTLLQAKQELLQHLPSGCLVREETDPGLLNQYLQSRLDGH